MEQLEDRLEEEETSASMLVTNYWSGELIMRVSAFAGVSEALIFIFQVSNMTSNMAMA
jgi:hypothetical protein